MEIKDKASLIEKVNISNNKVEEIILNKSDKNIIIKNSKNSTGNLSFSKKSTSPPGRIRAYKNKYNSPEISRLNQNDKNKVILDIKHFKNKKNNNYNEANNQFDYAENSINPLNSQKLSRKILLKEKMFDDIDNDKIRLTDIIMGKKELDCLHNSYNIDSLGFLKNNNLDFLKKSNSSNEFHLKNKELSDGLNKLKKMEKQRNYELIDLDFPKEHIIKHNSIEIIPGQFDLIKSNKNKKGIIMNNTDKQIINQENIIINNGFVNMNNNYYVNNNINNNIDKIRNNENYINKDINDMEFNNNINYKNNVMYNSNNIFDSKIINLDIINNQPQNLIEFKIANNIDSNKSNKIYINPKHLNRPEYIYNYKKDNKQQYDANYSNEENNSYNDSKEGNINLEENNFEKNDINNISDHPFLRNKSPRIQNKNFSRNGYKQGIIPNPQYFQPNFHPSIPLHYITILQIQYPVQMMVKKTKKFKLAKHKLINYYPPKIQLEMRPCLVFQPILPKKKKNKKKKIPKNERMSHNKVKHIRPVFKIPPFKKASLSQGKSLNFIHKYYDENFILEEDNEEDNKSLKEFLFNGKQKNEIKTNNNIRNIHDQNNENKNINKINNTMNNERRKESKDKIEEKKKDEIKSKSIDNKSIKKNNSYKNINTNFEKKIITKQKYVNRMKIPIRKDNIYKKNKIDKILLINIKKSKQSPIKEITINKKNIQNIFSLNEVKQRFSLQNNSTRINSNNISLDKNKEKKINNKSKDKIVNQKNINKSKIIKIINCIPRKKIMQKSNSFFAKKIVDQVYNKKPINALNNSYKDLSRKKVIEKINSNNLSQKNKIIRIDLSQL